MGFWFSVSSQIDHCGAILCYRFQRLSGGTTSFKCFFEKSIYLEKIRDHVQYERTIMAVRFSDYFVGTQFHPEADPISFIANLRNKESKEKIKKMKGNTKFRNMLEDLLDDDKIYRTNETLIPNFLRIAINDLLKTKKMLSN